MSGIIIKTLAWAILLSGAISAIWKAQQFPQWAEPLYIAPLTIPHMQSQQPLIKQSFVSDLEHAKVHSASITRFPRGGLMATWFAGSVEGGSDVEIYTAQYRDGKWTKARSVVQRLELAKELHRKIRRIGNPLIYMDRHNHLWCFFVTTSLGGWSTASINLMHSYDDGKSWSQPRRLVTSPFLNMSTLLRNPPLELEDGGLLIPVYHEFLGRFPELLRVSVQGEVVDKKRISTLGIQPVLTRGNDGDWYAFLRSRTGEVVSFVSSDGTHSWDLAQATGLPNPDASILVTRISAQLWMSVGNNNPRDRTDLTLAFSRKLPNSWADFFQLEYEPEERFSYPSIVQSTDGIWHLLYSWKENNIKHVRFNQAWLDSLIKKPDK